MLSKSHLTFRIFQRFIYLRRRHRSCDSIRKHDEYNYFKRSILRTDHVQHSLSIFKLELTRERYSFSL
jgi:hypothetical protein